MFKNLSLPKLEEILHTLYKSLPNLPHEVKQKIVEILPYIVFLASLLYLIPAILPSTGYLMPVTTSDFLIANVILFRIGYIIIGIILLLSFKPLTYKHRKGWYNLFYISLFQAFFSAVLFDFFSILLPFILWYFLFQIREFYS